METLGAKTTTRKNLLAPPSKKIRNRGSQQQRLKIQKFLNYFWSWGRRQQQKMIAGASENDPAQIENNNNNDTNKPKTMQSCSSQKWVLCKKIESLSSGQNFLGLHRTRIGEFEKIRNLRVSWT